ncbi:putative serine/threonine-protein kinase iks1 [Dimargaris verticillata]|uniref:non-specific serine/threonine protein kinase n=1 Tax=Dimargaris verticillata TaxID=2761393 RepID=A0A9W8B1E6_9FUNG|nr:putative serine/threonine-protein kinase iks1 [Dimargaris verticillata]
MSPDAKGAPKSKARKRTSTDTPGSLTSAHGSTSDASRRSTVWPTTTDPVTPSQSVDAPLTTLWSSRSRQPTAPQVRSALVPAVPPASSLAGLRRHRRQKSFPLDAQQASAALALAAPESHDHPSATTAQTPTALVPPTYSEPHAMTTTQPPWHQQQMVRYSPHWLVILRRPQQNQLVLYSPQRNQVAVCQDQPYSTQWASSSRQVSTVWQPQSRGTAALTHSPPSYSHHGQSSRACFFCGRPFDTSGEYSTNRSRPADAPADPEMNASYARAGSSSAPYMDRNYFRVLAALPPTRSVFALSDTSHDGTGAAASSENATPATAAQPASDITLLPSRDASPELRPTATALGGSLPWQPRPMFPTRASTTPQTLPQNQAMASSTTAAMHEGDDEPATVHLSPGIFNQGYYQRFFVEERKLGRGLRGAVYLCQHMLDKIPLGQYAVKKVPIGDNKLWLKRMLREVKLLETLHHPNIIDYKHSWIELEQPSRFGPKIPCLFILMDCANGGNLEQYLEGPDQDGHQPAGENGPNSTPPGSAPLSSPQDVQQEATTVPQSADPAAALPADESDQERRQCIEQRKQRVRQARQRRRRQSTQSAYSPDSSPSSVSSSSPLLNQPVHSLHTVEPGATTPVPNSPHLPTAATTNRRLSAVEVYAMFQDVCHGLAHLHHHGIIHRDIKPSNLLLHYPDLANHGSMPRVILSDFGECVDTAHIEMRKRTGATGTLEFMAPELIQLDTQGQFLDEYSVKADVWSLGMILHYLCYSCLPYSQIENVDLLRQEILAFRTQQLATPGDPLTSAAAIPTELIMLMHWTLQPDPTQRPTVLELLKSDPWRQFARRCTLELALQAPSTPFDSSNLPTPLDLDQRDSPGQSPLEQYRPVSSALRARGKRRRTDPSQWAGVDVAHGPVAANNEPLSVYRLHTTLSKPSAASTTALHSPSLKQWTPAEPGEQSREAPHRDNGTLPARAVGKFPDQRRRRSTNSYPATQGRPASHDGRSPAPAVLRALSVSHSLGSKEAHSPVSSVPHQRRPTVPLLQYTEAPHNVPGWLVWPWQAWLSNLATDASQPHPRPNSAIRLIKCLIFVAKIASCHWLAYPFAPRVWTFYPLVGLGLLDLYSLTGPTFPPAQAAGQGTATPGATQVTAPQIPNQPNLAAAVGNAGNSGPLVAGQAQGALQSTAQAATTATNGVIGAPTPGLRRRQTTGAPSAADQAAWAAFLKELEAALATGAQGEATGTGDAATAAGLRRRQTTGAPSAADQAAWAAFLKELEAALATGAQGEATGTGDAATAAGLRRRQTTGAPSAADQAAWAAFLKELEAALATGAQGGATGTGAATPAF